MVELGPGSGNQASRYDASKVTKIYGIEPNAGLHEKLRTRIKQAKLDDIYTIIPCGVENVSELEKYGISEESVDTVLTCQVLCSVPEPEETAHHLYRLLKRGGKLIAYEHIKSQDSVSRTVQGPSILFLLRKSPFSTLLQTPKLKLEITNSIHGAYRSLQSCLAIWPG